LEVQKLTMDKDQARALYNEYRAHSDYQTKDDAAIAAIYKRIAQGKLVIRALASITAAGVDEKGLPKLAIMRADQREAHLQVRNDEMIFYSAQTRGSTARFSVPMPGVKHAHWDDNKRYGRKAQVPLIPVHLRPRKGIQNYCILWEADWQAYPIDPYLLRRCGQDAWIVVAAWDLTPVERAVMSSRLNT
jgi:hypothetical protein